MKKLSFFITILLTAATAIGQGVAINEDGAAPDPSAMLDVTSTLKGVLIPRMNLSQRNEISLPQTGLLIFQTDNTPGFYYNAGTPASPVWTSFSGVSGQWQTNGSDIFYSDGNVGIGETDPMEKLHVSVPGAWAGVTFTGTGLNDLTVSISGYTGVGPTQYAIRIQNAGPNPNMIEISSDGGSSWSSPVPITPNIDVGYGVYANFANAYGYTYYDLWEWTVNQSFPDMLIVTGGSVCIGNDQSDESAILKLSSTNKGFLPPCMSQSQRTAVNNPAVGLLVYQTDDVAGYYYYNGTNWVGIAGSGVGAILAVSCIDYDGNAYPNLTIGTQVWMAENLRVTHYRNGDPIPNVIDGSAWSALTTGAFCWYNNDQSTNAKYGTLYNWYAVDDSRGLCPDGWHVPSDVEWAILTTYLGGENVAGGKMKSLSALWNSPNFDATNNSGFSALPGGYRDNYGDFGGIGNYSNHYTATGFSNSAWVRATWYSNSTLTLGHSDKTSGYNVRCLKD